MVVGNIVNCNKEIDEKYFNCVSLETYLNDGVGNDLPTLIIGWSEVKANFKSVSILNKTITKGLGGKNGVYWTFSPKEKRGIYEEELKNFKKKCYEDLTKTVNIHNIDPLLFNIKTTDELILKISKLTNGFGYLYQGRIVYVYKDDKILMFDLDLIEFINFNKELIINSFKQNLQVFSENLEEGFKEELKHVDIRYTPYLKYLECRGKYYY